MAIKLKRLTIEFRDKDKSTINFTPVQGEKFFKIELQEDSIVIIKDKGGLNRRTYMHDVIHGLDFEQY